MKRVALAAILLALAVTAHAQNLGPSVEISPTWTISNEMYAGHVKTVLTMNYLTAGGVIDGKFLEGRLGLMFPVGDFTRKTTTDFLGSLTTTEDTQEISDEILYLTLEGLFKYPISKKGLTWFPAGGILAALNVVNKDQDGNELEKQHLFWAKLGAGADLKLSPKAVIRGRLMLGFRFLTEAESDAVRSAKNAGYDAGIIPLRLDAGVSVLFKL